MGDLTKNISRWEVACKCNCGFDTIDYKVVWLVQKAADHFGAFVRINSGCRCPQYNAKIKGAEKSQHTLGRAIDFVLYKIGEDGKKVFVNPVIVSIYLESLLQNQCGIGSYSGFTHVDSRNIPARWSG